ncbi:MAG: ABC transporter permease [Dehalococcoidia bacterium]|nr:ABC transporter permease [Dehalococcoidia bacterium]
MNYVLSRLVRQFVPVIFIASVLIFALMELLPGDPALIILGETATPESVEALREEMGLNEPLPQRYLTWLGNSLTGDFGRSVTGKQVTELVQSSLPPTLELAFVAFTFGNLLGITMGIVAGINRGRLPDIAIGLASSLLIAVPSFVAGLIILLVFAVWLEWFPSAGRVAFTDDPVESAKHVILPALALGGIIAAVISRFTRQSIVDTLTNDYIRTARAKGLSERTVILRHALKPSMMPVVTVVGLQLGGLIGGTIVVEQVFTWPGMGRLLVNSINARDYPTIQSITLLLVGSYLLFNLLTDLAYGWLDPRIRLGHGVGA